MSALLFLAAILLGAVFLSLCGLLIVANPDRSEEEAELEALRALRRRSAHSGRQTA